jgi:cytochrome b561
MDISPTRNLSQNAEAQTGQYNPLAKTFHWATVGLMFTVLPIAWYMTDLAKNDPARGYWYTMHKSVGMAILLLTVLRLIWAFLAPPPSLNPSLARLQQLQIKAAHALLYLALLAMPLSGYVMSAASGREISFFWQFKIPLVIPADKGLAHFAHELHEIGQWALYALLALHVLAVIFHVFIKRDQVMRWMAPGSPRA